MFDLDKMSLEEVESFGKEIQSGITYDVSKLVDGVRSIELGETGKQITDMVVSAQGLTKSVQPKGLMKVFTSSKKWLKRYDTVENTINGLDDAINHEIERLSSILNGCYENGRMLKDRLNELSEREQELDEAIRGYSGDDAYKLSSAVHRQKTLVSTMTLIRQELGKSMLVIEQNKEITNQLSEARDNVIPYIKIMLVNTLASKANSEALALKKSLKKAVNNMVVQTANEISSNADAMIAGRGDTLLETDSIQKANDILLKTYEKIQSNVEAGIDSDKELVDSLKTSMQYLESYNNEG